MVNLGMIATWSTPMSIGSRRSGIDRRGGGSSRADPASMRGRSGSIRALSGSVRARCGDPPGMDLQSTIDRGSPGIGTESIRVGTESIRIDPGSTTHRHFIRDCQGIDPDQYGHRADRGQIRDRSGCCRPSAADRASGSTRDRFGIDRPRADPAPGVDGGDGRSRQGSTRSRRSIWDRSGIDNQAAVDLGSTRVDPESIRASVGRPAVGARFRVARGRQGSIRDRSGSALGRHGINPQPLDPQSTFNPEATRDRPGQIWIDMGSTSGKQIHGRPGILPVSIRRSEVDPAST